MSTTHFSGLNIKFAISAANTINNTGGTALTDGFGLVVYLDKDAA